MSLCLGLIIARAMMAKGQPGIIGISAPIIARQIQKNANINLNVRFSNLWGF